MMHNMDHMERSCVVDDKVGMFDQLEQSKICILNVPKLGILRLTIKHDFIFSIAFMKHHRDIWRQTSPGIVSIYKCAFHFFES
jgi:hypothetical protein